MPGAVPDGDDRPLLSVIVPSYNQGRFIGETLASIVAQDYRPIEVLVIDGGSTDGTVDILRGFAERHGEVRWWSERDSGVVEAVNKGLARASGPVAAIQSSDDVYLPGAFRAAVAALDANPSVGIVYGDFYPMDENGVPVGPPTQWASFSLARFLTRRTVITQYCAFFRLELARSLGGWRDDYFVADEDLWYRMVFRTSARKLHQVISGSRRHPEQRDKQTRTIWESYGRLIGESQEISRASWRLRLAAAAGRRVMAQYYDPAPAGWFVTYQLWRAVATYPPAWAAIGDKRLLLPRRGFIALPFVRRRARSA